MGEVHRGMEDAAAAKPLYEEALALARKQENILSITVTCDNLARVFIPLGEMSKARDLAREVLVISNEARSRKSHHYNDYSDSRNVRSCRFSPAESPL